MRSNDAFKAAFMNLYAFVAIGEWMAHLLSIALDRKIELTQVDHNVNSFHVYGSYFSEFEGFLKTVEARSFEGRTWTRSDMTELVLEARVKVLDWIDREIGKLRESGNTDWINDLKVKREQLVEIYRYDPYYPMEGL